MAGIRGGLSNGVCNSSGTYTTGSTDTEVYEDFSNIAQMPSYLSSIFCHVSAEAPEEDEEDPANPINYFILLFDSNSRDLVDESAAPGFIFSPLHISSILAPGESWNYNFVQEVVNTKGEFKGFPFDMGIVAVLSTSDSEIAIPPDGPFLRVTARITTPGSGA